MLDLQDLRNAISSLGKPKEEYFLILARKFWESEVIKAGGYSFSKNELDDAEKSPEKLIGTRNGVKCYLTKPFI